MPRPSLRWKILTLTTLPLLALAGATMWLVDRGVRERSEVALGDDLLRAAGVFENMLDATAAELDVAGKVIVRDPRFFSVLALPHGRNDPDFRATVAGVAQDFHQLARPDVFEVVDQRGELISSVGRIHVQSAARRPLAKRVLSGQTERLAIAERGTHVLLVATPTVADGRVVGALLLGHEVSGRLAARLRELTNSEVSFLNKLQITRSTLVVPEERDVARQVAQLAATEEMERPIRNGGWIAYARPLPMAAGGTRQLYVLQRSLSAELAFLHSVRGHLVELGLLLIAAVALAAMFIARHITSPIQELVTAASAMEQGEWEVPIRRDRHDEIGYLATRFDDMRLRQRTFVRSLQEVARAKSEFIAVASHELRTPISIIRGWEELLRHGLVRPESPKYQEGLDAISRACVALEKIAISATHMTQMDEGNAVPAPTAVDVEPMLSEAIHQAASAAPDRKVTLSLDVQPDAEVAILDRRMLIHAMDALVRNGIRFTPDGGSVEVTARARAEDLSIEVRDTGIGLTAEARERLFDDAYVQRESRHHHTARGLEFNVAGLGLGLVLVRRVVEAHGGRLEVTGEEGRGSCFTLHFPGTVLAAAEPDRGAA